MQAPTPSQPRSSTHRHDIVHRHQTPHLCPTPSLSTPQASPMGRTVKNFLLLFPSPRDRHSPKVSFLRILCASAFSSPHHPTHSRLGSASAFVPSTAGMALSFLPHGRFKSRRDFFSMQGVHVPNLALDWFDLVSFHPRPPFLSVCFRFLVYLASSVFLRRIKHYVWDYGSIVWTKGPAPVLPWDACCSVYELCRISKVRFLSPVNSGCSFPVLACFLSLSRRKLHPPRKHVVGE
jgi:hypothetical protein